MTTRPFAVFDIDGTLIRWQLFHAIADALLVSNPDAHTKIQLAREQWKRRTHEESFREYELELLKSYEEAICGMSVEIFQAAIDTVFDEYKDQVYRYTRNLIKELKQQNYLLFAISGSNDEIVSKIADYYGFDDYIGAKYAYENGHLTGKMAEQTFGLKHKLLPELVAKHQTTFEGSFGVGDSEGDIGMLDLVEHPIAFNPSKKLFNHAKTAGWKIVIERKNMSYELELQHGTYVLA